jgi:NAD(P)H-dependent FMN reductase
VTPEYNHSIPGSLKRMLDSEYENYWYKAVAFGGASNGSWGGVRAIEALATTTRALGLAPTFVDVQFPRVQDIFSEDGQLQDDKMQQRVEKVWHELIWMAAALKYGRENIDRMN